jgi:hypothetical protein
MRAVGTHPLAAFTARSAGLVGGKFMSRTLLVRCLTALAGDLALAIAIHGCKSTISSS